MRFYLTAVITFVPRAKMAASSSEIIVTESSVTKVEKQNGSAFPGISAITPTVAEFTA